MTEATEADDDETEIPAKRPPSVTVKQFIDSTQLAKDMSYSLTDLSSAMMTQASLFANYGVLAAKASRQVDDLKLILQTTESAVYRKVRDEAASSGTKMTEAQVENQVATSARVVTLKRAINEAKQVEAVAKTAVEAFRHRRDMLVQAGLISREEMKGEVSINRRNEAEREVEEMKERFINRRRDHQEEAA